MSSASATDSAPAPAAGSNRWPPQVRYILGNEAAERFSYYGMKGILSLYITTTLMQTKDTSTNIVHLFGFANYFMPLIGAWVSDRFWGRYNTILWISLSYCVGHGVLACSDLFHTVDGKLLCLYIGLALIAFGAGGIKPCVAAFMGDQFRPDQRHLLQKAYAAFYWAINLGSTAAFLIIPWIRDRHGYGWAFGVPGIAMGLATLIFWIGTPKYTRVPPASQTKSAGFFTVLCFAWANSRNRRAGQSFWDSARGRFSDAEVDAARSVAPILSIFAMAPIFWALFDQTFSTWVQQGAQMTPWTTTLPLIGDYKVGPEEMLAANPILVMIFLPIMTLAVYPLLGRLATPLRRMSAGMFLSAGSFVVVAMIQTRIDAGEKLSILWQLIPYVIITIAEILFSTTGNEFAFREAAPSMKSTIMGFWNLTVSIGNLMVPIITWIAAKSMAGSVNAGEVSVSPKMFMVYAGLTFVIAIGFSVVCAFYKYRDSFAAQGK